MTANEDPAVSLREIEDTWREPSGFFYRLRQGHFDEEAFSDGLVLLASLEQSEDETISKRLVSLIWFIPLFMDWQTPRVIESGGSLETYRQAVIIARNQVERILGLP